ncbi:recombinase RecT [Breoghania sp.]|uniref:recombinase RecT n=1 Tax=Breoghania sp. TaxID=2065378 RepID=UPI002AA8AF26|nr:recombinase RecT [Breoghania sp.]
MTAQNALVEHKPKPMSLRERLTQMTPEFAKALPGHISADKFVRTIQTAIQMQPDIGDACQTKGGMQSLFAACTKAATDGLILDGREAALVAFNCKVSKNPDKWEKHVQYLPMVAGLMKKARNSGEIASIAAHVVFEKDTFQYVLGDEERIEHIPKFGDRGAPVAVYAIVRMKDGSIQREVMDRTQVMAVGAQGKNAHQYDPEKGKNYGEWWRKTVIRRISKYLPSSSDRDEFMSAVERIDEDYDFEASNGGETVPAAIDAPKKRGGGAAALKNITPVERQNNAPRPAPGTGGTKEAQVKDADYEQMEGDDI